MNPATTRSIWAAVLLSFLLHSALLFWFMGVRVGEMIIPAQRDKVARPFEMRRVEIPAQLLQPGLEKMLNTGAVARPVEPPQRMPEPGKLTDATLLANLPSPILPDLPTGQIPDLAPKIMAAPTNLNPYTLNEQAKLSAEIAKFSVGPDLGKIAIEGAALPSAISSMGGPPPGGGGVGSVGVGSAIPSLEEIQAQFRLTAPTIDPTLPQPVIVRLPSDILFEFNASTLNSSADPMLQLAVEYMQKFGRAEIEVEGHTDTIGEEPYNQKLSLARAESVRSWLQARMSVGDYKFSAKGWGESRPIVNPDGNVAEQQKNRRVEIMIRALK
jgi:OmpA-OmpF porin, OOP family